LADVKYPPRCRRAPRGAAPWHVPQPAVARTGAGGGPLGLMAAWSWRGWRRGRAWQGDRDRVRGGTQLRVPAGTVPRVLRYTPLFPEAHGMVAMPPACSITDLAPRLPGRRHVRRHPCS
jgi:hypothetical protein